MFESDVHSLATTRNTFFKELMPSTSSAVNTVRALQPSQDSQQQVFVEQPPGFEVKDKDGGDMVMQLEKSLYGLA